MELADIKENLIKKTDSELLNILLKDRTTDKNIIGRTNMEKKDNNLTVESKSFFTKIKEFFLNIFKKSDKSDDIEKEVESTEENNTEIENNGINNEVKKQDDKEEFLKKYKAYKNNEIDESHFTGSELVKVNAMLEEELKMNQDKFNNLNKKRNNESN